MDGYFDVGMLSICWEIMPYRGSLYAKERSILRSDIVTCIETVLI